MQEHTHHPFIAMDKMIHKVWEDVMGGEEENEILQVL
jgi:hypothetical protein